VRLRPTAGTARFSADVPGTPTLFVDQLGDRELARAVDSHEQIQLAFGGLHLGDIHVEEVDGIALEALTLRLVAFSVGSWGSTLRR
jgi:hypothetical protein